VQKSKKLPVGYKMWELSNLLEQSNSEWVLSNLQKMSNSALVLNNLQELSNWEWVLSNLQEPSNSGLVLSNSEWVLSNLQERSNSGLGLSNLQERSNLGLVLSNSEWVLSNLQERSNSGLVLSNSELVLNNLQEPSNSGLVLNNLEPSNSKWVLSNLQERSNWELVLNNLQERNNSEWMLSNLQEPSNLVWVLSNWLAGCRLAFGSCRSWGRWVRQRKWLVQSTWAGRMMPGRCTVAEELDKQQVPGTRVLHTAALEHCTVGQLGTWVAVRWSKTAERMMPGHYYSWSMTVEELGRSGKRKMPVLGNFFVGSLVSYRKLGSYRILPHHCTERSRS
jgi:hypothetical protein